MRHMLTITLVCDAKPMRAKAKELLGTRLWTGLAWCPPTHWLTQHNRTAATGRFCSGCCGWIRTLAITIHGITEVQFCI